MRVRERVHRACGELIQKHLDLLLLLLAERGVTPAEQRERADVLVRCLTQARFEESLFVQGRRVPMLLDAQPGAPPVLTLSAEFLEKVDDDELFSAFTRPICDLLGLAPINVGLVLQGRDERQLRNLYHSARGRVQGEVVRAVSVRAVVERRVTTFTGRLRELVQLLTRGLNSPLPSPLGFIGWLERADGRWPEWAEIASQDFIVQVCAGMEATLGAQIERIPCATLVEMCWESLDLSPQSFLRQAARDLRSRDLPVTEHLLRVLGEVIAREDLAAIERLEEWPSMEDLSAAWQELAELEMTLLGRYHRGVRTIASISTLQAPRDSMSLREPDNLPWDYPLLCWSVRESAALRDLLMGLVHERRRVVRPDSEVELLLLDAPPAHEEPPLGFDGPRQRINAQVVGTTLDAPPGYEVMSARAINATLARLQRQIEALSEPQRINVLNRIRGCYEGFFMSTGPVWQRRLQGWRLDPLPEALRRLTLAVSELLHVPVIFDPFESPEESTLRPVPTFCFIVPLGEAVDRVPFHIPISTLLMTAATGTPPLRVRVVHVPNDGDAACQWLGDLDLAMETMQGQPVHLTLAAIEDDMLRMIAVR